MLRSMHDLEGYAIHATDGTIGHVKDFYFDDKTWVVRYFVVETGTWLSSRKVLISPIAIKHSDWTEKLFHVSITQDQVRHSPDIDTEKPVSRQHEADYMSYYGYPYYWGGGGLWGDGFSPYMMSPADAGFGVPSQPVQSESAKACAQAGTPQPHSDDPHLRSCKAVVGYHIHATDGDIGHVKSLLVDEETWAVRYMVVDTGNWWVGQQVVIAPQWIQSVSWPDASVSVDLTRQAVKDAPRYDSAASLDRTREMGIHEHYRRSGYWENEAKPGAAKPYPMFNIT